MKRSVKVIGLCPDTSGTDTSEKGIDSGLIFWKFGIVEHETNSVAWLKLGRVIVRPIRA